MLRHYLTIAIRSLGKQRLYTCINIAGLSIGMAACLLIFLFINDEYGFDKFHHNAERIFRAAQVENYEGREYFSTSTPFPLAQALTDSYPEIEEAVRVAKVTDIVKRGGHSFSEPYHLVDSGFFRVFTFPLVQGDELTALASPNNVVISARISEKYFGEQNPLGQSFTIKLDSIFEEFTVTGVTANTPSASSIQFDILIPMSNCHKLWRESLRSSWTDVWAETYLLTKPGVTPEQLEAKVPAMVKKIAGDKYVEGQVTERFQPITDIHLNTEFPPGIQPTSNPAYSYILGGIALAILSIGCINFVTLAVARAAGRAKEVGIRKVAGAGRFQLLKQFWGETIVLSLISLLVAIVIAEFTLPVFNSIAGKDLALRFDLMTMAAAAALLSIVSIIGGNYPALILARFQPAQVLKGKMSIQRSNRLRQALVIVQFSLAIGLVACTFTMSRQFHFLQNRPMGYEREHIVTIPTNLAFDGSKRIAERLRQSLVQSGDAVEISFALNSLGEPWYNIGWFVQPGDYRWASLNRVDKEFLPAMSIDILQGRNFSVETPSDTLDAALVNEAFVQAFGITDPIGKPLPGSLSPNKIIGVVKDFHYASLHQKIEPLILTMRAGNILRLVEDASTEAPGHNRLLVRFTPGALTERIQRLEKAWKLAAGDRPCEPTFLDAAIESQYRNDRRLGQIVSYASILVLIISSLGLFGLAAISVVRRTKEIGVRKVLGATSLNILGLLWHEAIWLVAIACLLAWPLAYYAMNRWLEDFAYREALHPLIFLAAGLLGLLIALVTVSYHSLRASTSNPVDSLRCE
ncbi:MAG: ABC transporter permease [bacterium]|nr:ABC transporter permease [bacterium]